MIESLQRGVTIVNDLPTIVPIDPVTLNRACVFSTFRASWASSSHRTPRIWLSDTDEVSIQSNGSGNNSHASFEVLEFADGIGALVQRGENAVAGASAVVDVTLPTAVDLDRTMVIVTASSTENNGATVSGWMTSDTNLRLTGGTGASIARWEVVQLPTGYSVQQIIESRSNTDDTVRDLTLGTAVPLDRSFVFHNHSSSGSSFTANYATTRLLDTNTVRLELLGGRSDNRRYGIFVVTMPDEPGVTVQRLQATQQGGHTPFTETLDPVVDLSRSTVAADWNGYGRTSAESTLPYRLAATKELTANDTLSIRRDQSDTETVTWEIEVVTWPESSGEPEPPVDPGDHHFTISRPVGV